MVDQVTEITLAELTTASLTGDGVFDVLMGSASKHIQQEFKAGRLKGPEYSTVYLGQLQACMDQSIRFLLERDANLLIQKQLDAAEQDVLLKTEQISLAQKELELKDKELLLADKAIEEKTNQVALLDVQKQAAQAELLNIPKQGAILDQQKLDLVASTSVKTQERTNLQVENTNLARETDFIIAKTGKTDSEKGLITQKRTTELAQTSPVATYGSLLDAQKSVYQHQAESFVKDGKIRAGKIAADLLSVASTVDSNITQIETNVMKSAVQHMIDNT